MKDHELQGNSLVFTLNKQASRISNLGGDSKVAFVEAQSTWCRDQRLGEMYPQFTTQAHRAWSLKARRKDMVMLAARLSGFGSGFLDADNGNVCGVHLMVKPCGPRSSVAPDFILLLKIVEG